MSEPRAYTAEEVREMLLSHVRATSAYWATVPQGKTVRERCDGLAFSILVMLDGGTELPAFDLSLSPHPDDKAYLQGNGENWFEAGMVVNDCQLHELFYPPARDEKGAEK